MSDQTPKKPDKQLSIVDALDRTVPSPDLSGRDAISEATRVDARRTQFSAKEDRQEFFIPVSGFTWLFPEEVVVANHPAFQRLGKIYQLGQTYLVYRGATHKRFEHALGAVSVVQRMIDAVDHNGEKGRKNENLGTSLLLPEERHFIRLGTLLHDIGHMAAGHTVEDELGLVGRHDADGRLDLVFNGKDWSDSQERTLAELINSIFAVYIPEELADQEVTASEVVRLLIRKTPCTKEEKERDPFGRAQKLLEVSTSIRLQVCRDIIGNTICADLLDYLHRDWYHIGKPRPFDDRILQYMEIRGRPNLPSPEDKFVISLRRSPKIRTDAISNILDLLEWRYQLMESVIYHRSKLAAAAMLDRALYELWGDSSDNIEQILLPLSDEQMLSRCLELATKRKEESKSKSQQQSGAIAVRLLEALQKRQLFADLSTRFYGDLPPGVALRPGRGP